MIIFSLDKKENDKNSSNLAENDQHLHEAKESGRKGNGKKNHAKEKIVAAHKDIRVKV